MRRTLVISSVIIVATALAVGGYGIAKKFSKSTSASLTVSAKDKGSVATIAQQATYNLSAELQKKAVPTNTWWISALTGDVPETLSPLPFMIQFVEGEVRFGLPSETAQKNSVIAVPNPDISLKLASGRAITRTTITAYDATRVSLDLHDPQNTPSLSLTLQKGSPFQDVSITQPLYLKAVGATLEQLKDSRWVLSSTKEGRSYRIYSATKPSTISENTFLYSGGSIRIGALPSGISTENIGTFDTLSLAQVTKVSTEYEVREANSITRLSFTTSNGKPTAFLLLPHQQLSSAQEKLGTYWTIRGTAFLSSGNTISTIIPRQQAAGQLTLPDQDSAFFFKEKLEQYLQKELQVPQTTPAGSYSGGKELYRLANLAQLAEQTKSATADGFTERLRVQLIDWLTYTPDENGHYFAYDTIQRGLIAQSPEFGIEQYNDHHFQYGYFLYAASIYARYDSSFVKEYGSTVDAIIRDIASSDATATEFPYFRTIDWYEGHSWAGGTARFADGNNQESVSEAINAWYGLLEWGKATNNSELTKRGQWLYDQEITAAYTYWFNQGPATAKKPAIFGQSSASLVWASKYDWATWFSDKPEAKHGILYLPLSPGSAYLDHQDLIDEEMTSLTAALGGGTPTEWKDTILMVQALKDPTKAQQGFSETVPLDPSNSLPYFYAWLAAVR